MLDTVLTAAFGVALLKIIWVNVLLSGDNAVVIALAARNLPPRQQRAAVIIGSAGAIALRVLLTVFAVQLLEYPYLKLAGSVLLLWIGIQLMADGDDDAPGDGLNGHDTLWAAVRTVLLADLVMSLDNVIAVAAAAQNAPGEAKLLLLVLGLGLSIPLIIFGSTLLLKLMERFPVIITLGAALLGFVAGEMAVTDPAIHDWFNTHLHDLDYAVSLSCAALVVAVGLWAQRRGPGRAAPR
ncbi:MAG: TerC family protein [Betaproteobacteria bacterium]|nr:TerC family protein [Betaproteobacteria bacterium]